MSLTENDKHTEFEIKDTRGKTFTVTHDISLNTSTCSCKHFELYGWLCSHVFAVLRNLDSKIIPSAYILSRWTKTAINNPSHNVLTDAAAKFARTDDKKHLMNKLWSDIHICMGLAEPCIDRLTVFSNIIEAQKIKLMYAQEGGTKIIDREHQFESFVGTSAPTEVSINPPSVSKNKGSGKRIKSAKEKAIESSQKKRRVCKSCGERSGHNGRTCPKNL
ncbi:Protein FAR1-RELATED SEQUENCE 7 [Striga hermonthica]|uniref:Protein FAR1-RELATED SEQUENCE 7 n=1 Tax=Striga hermonthica TaxID=68872 RepID=A0A9N7MZV3_STRHE|nr:Protein FAR1-RELATED SEQUENCE 7 [Striga hermonthica]